MTASALVTIFCDAPSCGQWDEAGVAHTAKEARAGLRRGNGPRWALNVKDPESRLRLDYCPLHAHLATPVTSSTDTAKETP